MLAMNQVPAERSTDGSIGKKRRVESRISDVAKRGSAHDLQPSPALNSRDVMPPPPRPIGVLQTPKPTSSACYNQIPAPCFLNNLDANAQSFTFTPKVSAFCGFGQAAVVSDASVKPHAPAFHLGSPDGAIQDNGFSLQASGHRTNPSLQNSRQEIGHKVFSKDESDTNRFWQGLSSFQLPVTTGFRSQQRQFHSPQSIHPSMQHILNSRVPETNDFLGAITRAGTNMGSPTHYSIRADSYDDTYQCTRLATENANGGSFGLIESQRVNGFGGNNPHVNDGELDQFLPTASNWTIPLTPTRNRLSFPPRTSSLGGTPRLRTGMSANSRSSRSSKRIPLMTPNAPKFHRKPLGNTTINNQYGASPYSSSQELLKPVQHLVPLLASQWPLGQASYLTGASKASERGFQAGGNPPTKQHIWTQSDFQPNTPGPGARSGDRPFAAEMRRDQR